MTPQPPVEPEGRSGLAPWIVPVVAFLVGLLLGGVLIGVTRGNNDNSSTAAPPTPTASPTPTGSSTNVTLTVPAACLKAGDLAQQGLTLADQAVTAVRDLNAKQAQDIVAQMRALRPQVQAATNACRQTRLTASANPSAS